MNQATFDALTYKPGTPEYIRRACREAKGKATWNKAVAQVAQMEAADLADASAARKAAIAKAVAEAQALEVAIAAGNGEAHYLATHTA